MKSLVLFNPAISSINLGDHIIAESAKDELLPSFPGAFTVEVSTHLPVSRYLRYLRLCEHRFILGSNLLRGKMNRLFRQWDIGFRHASLVSPVTLMGVGWWQYGDKVNWYTKQLYKKVLSPANLHSVRDEYTRRELVESGFSNVVNTGCPSLWQLTESKCAEIPTRRSDRVVFTLTDYSPAPAHDSSMVRVLLQEYERVAFWVQGNRDLDYLRSLDVDVETIEVIPPTVRAYENLLNQNVDYVGTRLHGGIKALQMGQRTIIISIDNRAEEMHRDFGLGVVRRGDQSGLRKWIANPVETHLRIPEKEITRWKAQFA